MGMRPRTRQDRKRRRRPGPIGAPADSAAAVRTDAAIPHDSVIAPVVRAQGVETPWAAIPPAAAAAGSRRDRGGAGLERNIHGEGHRIRLRRRERRAPERGGEGGGKGQECDSHPSTKIRFRARRGCLGSVSKICKSAPISAQTLWRARWRSGARAWPRARFPAPRGGCRTSAMAKLYFTYSSMNAGKSTLLLQASHNYRERGMRTLLLTAALDSRAGPGRIASRIGIAAEAETFGPDDDLLALLGAQAAAAEAACARGDGGRLACVLVDEAQFLSPAQVWQLAEAADDLALPVMCYGLRTDFRGELFPGSAVLMALADSLREARTICHCGRKATMVARIDAQGRALSVGAQVEIGGDDRYEPLCRRHWRAAIAAGRSA
jgi:thymidine kinase